VVWSDVLGLSQRGSPSVLLRLRTVAPGALAPEELRRPCGAGFERRARLPSFPHPLARLSRAALTVSFFNFAFLVKFDFTSESFFFG
jgi:hypothetical protein